MIHLRPLAAALGALAIAVLGAGLAAPQGGPRGGKLACNLILWPRTDPGGCVGGYDVCPDPLGGPGTDCCRHFHEPMTWNEAFPWFRDTGMTRGPVIKKFYRSRDDTCVGSVCVPGLSGSDPQHFRLESTLVACPGD